MNPRFQQWWFRPVGGKDRVKAALIGGFGGFWLGLMVCLLIVWAPTSVLAFVLWGVGGASVGVVLGVLFPKVVTVLLYPFALFGISPS